MTETTPPAVGVSHDLLGVWLRRAVLWATGRDLLEPSLPTPPQGAHWTIARPPGPRWEMTFSADAYLTFALPAGPNVLHRLAQRLVLGIRWRMLPKATDAEITGLPGYRADFDGETQ